MSLSQLRERARHRQCSAVQPFSRVRLSATPWTAALQASLFVGFSRQEYCNGLPFPSPGRSSLLKGQTWFLALQADSEPPGKTLSPILIIIYFLNTYLKNSKMIFVISSILIGANLLSMEQNK